MATLEELRQQEDQLREEIRTLSDEQRHKYYQMERQQQKDPDTYAVLNYFFLAGLHHFYLGKTSRGMINLAVMLIGFIVMYGFPLIGLIIIVAIVIIELPQLFRSQQIVYEYNNQLMRDLIDQVKQS